MRDTDPRNPSRRQGERHNTQRLVAHGLTVGARVLSISSRHTPRHTKEQVR